MDHAKAEQIANQVIGVFKEKGGSDYAGEEITQLEHACQAGQLAEKQGFDEEVILAAFLHDLGHLLEEDGLAHMDGYGVKDHEAVGADYLLKLGFSEKLATLIRSHVAAKRYLCYANKRYYDNLSHASKMTLEFQGGPMSEEEAKAFEANPLKNLIIRMRTWDEEAKVKDVPMPDLNTYRDMMVRHLERSQN
ncbi:MAG TPA: HD domain-containing protein [Chitinophagales bacterium]|nr:HD domain-containing protein [Chitinophagales bacterium]